MMKRCLERLYNGLIKENPTFVLMLGMCPTLAVTTSAINGLGMGLSTMVVLALSNMIISALRKIIPDKVRIPAYIVIIATFVTIVELLMHAFVPGLYSALGIYISLIVVNCIILGRAESYASKNPVLPSLFDGIGMGLGFTMALTIIGLVREFLGAGTIFGIATSVIFKDKFGIVLLNLFHKIVSEDSTGFMKVINDIFSLEFSSFSPVGILVMAPGAFFVLATLTMIQNLIKDKGAKAGKDTSKIGSGCSSDCMNCSDMGCSRRLVDNKEAVKAESCITGDKVDASKENSDVSKEKSASSKENSDVSKEKSASSNEKSDPSNETTDVSKEDTDKKDDEKINNKEEK